MRIHNFTRRQALGLMAAGAGAVITPQFAKAANSGLPMLHKGSAGFDTTRASLTWNLRVAGARVPQAIVQAMSTADVAQAIKYARANKLKIAIRGGGHNYNGAALRDGSLLLDLSRLKTLKIDASARTASVGPGVKGADLVAALEPHKLAFPVGHCSDVNLSGFLLNGGWGWNFGAWGPSCLSITGMEMVTASGDVVYADETHNTDLFWAARGAGPGFFAVVTRFDLKLYPLPAIHNYTASYALADAPAMAKWLPGAVAKTNPGVEVDVMLGALDESGKPFITLIAAAFAPTAQAAAASVAPLRNPPAGLKRVGDTVDQAATFPEIMSGTDAGFPSGKRMAGDMYFSHAPIAELLLKLAPLAEHMPPAPSAIMLATLGGTKEPEVLKLDGQRASITASGSVDFGVYAFWDKAEDDAKNLAWVRQVAGAIAPLNSGSYVGEADLSSSPTRVQNCFSTDAWKRLVELRGKHDPDGLFHSYLMA